MKTWIRRITATVVLAHLIGGPVLAMTAAGPWEALCSVYKPSDPEYWVFYCYLVPPA